MPLVALRQPAPAANEEEAVSFRPPDDSPPRGPTNFLQGDTVVWVEGGGEWSFYGYAEPFTTGKGRLAVLHGHHPTGAGTNRLFYVPENEFVMQFRRVGS